MKKNRINKQRGKVMVSLILAALLFGTFTGLQAKKLLGSGFEKSENEFRIRTDGLACYFCAYGLERFFRKTGKIYSMDISLKKGLVTISFVKGKPIPSAKEIKGYIHDAGFSPRTITARLFGQLSSDGKTFLIKESGQSVPVKGDVSKLPREKDVIANVKIDANEKPFSLWIETVKSI